MTYALGIDVGTTYTAAAVARGGRSEVVALGYRATSVPTVVFLNDEGKFLVGDVAERRAATSPGRVAREFKRRVGDPTPLLIGGSPIAVDRCLAEVIRWVSDTVAETEGRRPGAVTVTHPANWGEFKRDVLHQALHMVDLPGAGLLAEPVAAATWYAQAERLAPGSTVAVYDLGGGTFDAAVLRRRPEGRIDGLQRAGAGGFETLGRAEGIERLGGIDIDQAIFAHVLRASGTDLTGLAEDPGTVAAVGQLRRACVEAKEALSAETSVAIPVWFPHVHHEVLLQRSELEELVWPLLSPTIDALARVVVSAGLRPDDLDAVLLVGGSSRVPLVARQVSAGLGRPVVVDAHPKHPVAMGAALDALARMGAAAPVAAPGPVPAPVVVPVPVPPAPAGPPGPPGGAWGQWGAPAPAPVPGPTPGPPPGPPGLGPYGGPGPTSGPRHAGSSPEDVSGRRLLLLGVASVVTVALVMALVVYMSRGRAGDDTAGDETSTGEETSGAGEGEGDQGSDVAVPEARLAWHQSLGEETTGEVTALDAERVYIVDDRGLVTAFVRASGEQAWQVDLGDSSTGSTPVRAGDVLIVGISEPDATYALNPTNGQTVWRSDGNWIDAPVVAGDVILGHSGNRVIGLDLGSGQARWDREIDLWAWGNMVVVGNVVATASDDGRLAGLDPTTGNQLWVLTVPRGDVDIWAVGKAGDHTVLAVDEDGHVTAVDAATGTQRWSKDLTANYFEPQVEVDGVLAIGLDGGEVAFVDPANGDEARERFSGPAISMRAAPGGVPAMIFAGISSLQAIDLDGRTLWSTSTPFDPTEVLVGDGAVVVSDLEGELATFNLG